MALRRIPTAHHALTLALALALSAEASLLFPKHKETAISPQLFGVAGNLAWDKMLLVTVDPESGKCKTLADASSIGIPGPGFAVLTHLFLC
jgi:hypothetical protein